MNNDMLINVPPKKACDLFVERYDSIHKIDHVKTLERIKETFDYYRGKSVGDTYAQRLKNRWYDSLSKNKPDYSVYDDNDYFTDLWVCWIMYSRAYVRAIVKENSLTETRSIYDLLKNVSSVVDLGCGIGYTTTALAEIFKGASVYGTNLTNTKQYTFCESQSSVGGFTLVPDISHINQSVDLVFASEYFEHIENATNQLRGIIKNLNPKFLYIANSFNTQSVGHFEWYREETNFGMGGIPQKDMTRLFNKRLTELGYQRIKTKLWNNKPMLWQRVDES